MVDLPACRRGLIVVHADDPDGAVPLTVEAVLPPEHVLVREPRTEQARHVRIRDVVPLHAGHLCALARAWPEGTQVLIGGGHMCEVIGWEPHRSAFGLLYLRDMADGTTTLAHCRDVVRTVPVNAFTPPPLCRVEPRPRPAIRRAGGSGRGR
ncbi:hypothetical protein [Nocardiopsis trehalosi]|jgi:hypothetical protein|uniref:hypothetical protein n=1 Tax=Nocardiopsis trehalosi TaxID=109329 RepID=UPI00082E6927|nr:hypothetical protein [Nocardiopsis trehalosi]